MADFIGLGVSLLLANHVDHLGIHVIGHEDRRLGLLELLRGPEGVGVVPIGVARQGDEPAAIGNEKWLPLTSGLHTGNRRAWRRRPEAG